MHLERPETLHSVFYPLGDFYERMNLPFPAVTVVEGTEVPEPARSLLVHKRDMTPTLEAAHGGRLQLQILRMWATETSMSRLVVLELEKDGTPVEVGAIQIHFNMLPKPARQAVIELHTPFGAILHQNQVNHYCRPAAYFKVTADRMLADALHTETGLTLYGRRNTIWHESGEPLAEVVEILPPGGGRA